MKKFQKFIGYILFMYISIAIVNAEDISLCKKAWQYKVSKSYDKAFEYFNKCIEKGNLSKASLARTYRNIGITYHAKHNNVKAIEYYTKAIKLNPRDIEKDYVNRANAWDDEGKYKKALSDYNMSLQITPKLTDVYYNRGIVYRRIGNEAKSLKNYLTAYKYGLKSKMLLKELQEVTEIETRNAAAGYVSTVRMFIEGTAKHCQTKLGQDKQWINNQIKLWEKKNNKYLMAAKKWLQVYNMSILNYNQEAGEALLKKNYFTTVHNAEEMVEQTLYYNGEKNVIENCKTFINNLNNKVYDISKKNKMYDELENLVDSKLKPLGEI